MTVLDKSDVTKIITDIREIQDLSSITAKGVVVSLSDIDKKARSLINRALDIQSDIIKARKEEENESMVVDTEKAPGEFDDRDEL